MKKHNTSIPALAFLFFTGMILQAQNLVTYIPTEKTKPVESDTVITVVDAAKGLKHLVVTENGITQMDGFLIGDKRTGKWFNYYPNGVLLSVAEYENGMKSGLYIECEKSGAVLVQEYYRNDQLNGEQKKYVTSKGVRIVKSIYNYSNGVYNGLCTDFTDMGTLQSQVQYANGKKNGTTKWYFSSGSLAMEQTYSNDMLNGEQKIYDQQGNLISTGTFSNNLKAGQWTEFYAGGKMKSQGTYSNDAKAGTWKYYDESGTLTKTENF